MDCEPIVVREGEEGLLILMGLIKPRHVQGQAYSVLFELSVIMSTIAVFQPVLALKLNR